MKKRVNIFLGFMIIFLIIGILSVGSVWAGGASERPSPEKNKCIKRVGFEYLFNPTGCDCVKGGTDDFKVKPLVLKWARSNWDSGGLVLGSDDSRGDDESEYYCYIDEPLSKIKPGIGSGKGEVRMCTEDNNSTYYGVSAVPASGGGQKGNKECDEDYPYCKDKKCNECLEDSDCSAKSYVPESATADCIFAKYYDKNKLCTYCQHISGSGDYKITFVVNRADMGNYSKFVDDIISIEPFKYLNYKNKFTFQVVDTFHLSSFLSLEYHSRGHQGAAVVQTSYLTKDAKKEIIDFSNEICGKTDLVIFIDGNYPQRYIIGQDGAIILLTESQPGYCSWQGNKFIAYGYYGDRPKLVGDIQHELGHCIGYLGDEYFYEFRGKEDYGLINLAKPNLDASNTEDQCQKFNSYGIPKPNCFEISSTTSAPSYNLRIEKGIRKSTSDSKMGDSDLFNIISCAGILNKVLGWDIKAQGVLYCKDTPTPEGYTIYPGIIPQGGIDACAVELEGVKSSTTKSKKCYCDDDPQQLKWERCATKKGIICCDKQQHEKCVSKTKDPLVNLVPFLNTKHCEADDTCTAANGKKKCLGDLFDACCDISDVCATTMMQTPKGPKQIAMCQPKECKAGDRGYCDTGANGVSYCCEAPHSDCVDVHDKEDPTKIVKYCMAKESDCTAGKELCSDAAIKTCCPTGTCDYDEDHLRAFCK